MVALDGADDIGGGDHGHAAGEDRSGAGTAVAEGVHAEAGVARGVAVAERDGAGFPAAAIVAAPERAHGVEELVVRVGSPVGRLASPGDDDTGAVPWPALAHGHGGGEVHDAGNGAQDARAVVNEPDELTHIGLPAKIEHAAQGQVMIATRADLGEEDLSLEMIDDGLPPLGGPPFDADIALAPGGDDPIRHIRADGLRDLRRPRALQRMQMDVALEQRGADAEVELAGEMFGEAMDAMPRAGVALGEQRIVTLDHLALLVPHRGDVGIVQPQIIERRAQIGEEARRMRAVQVANGGGEQRDVAEGIPAAEDELLFPCMGMREPGLRA